MNFIKKDKYRHKIIEHLLNQYGDSNENQNNHNLQQKSTNRQKQYQKYQNLHDMSQIDSNHARGYNMYQKVLSKQKALIIDEQQDNNIQQINKSHQIKKTNGYNLISKIKIKKNEQNKKNDKGLNQITQVILQQLKRHQDKQTYVYHQNNPILTTTSKLINKDKDFQKRTRNLSINDKQNFQYELNTKVINQKKDNLKSQKKYRFISQNKVHEALLSKRKMQLFQQNNDIDQQKDNNLNQYIQNIKQKRNNDQNIAPSATHRSKGSQQMMQFLQSARQKLFLSKNTDHLICQNEINKSNEQNQIQQDFKNYKCKSFSKNNKDQQQIDKFQIQIQISPNNNRIIQLTQKSNPISVAKQFISQNKQQLSRKGFFNKKMQEILAQRIQMQIQQHKKLSIQQKQKDIETKYKKIIHQLGVREHLLQDDQDIYGQDKLKSLNCQKNQYKQNKETTRKKYRKQSFSHVYVENIELTPHQQQSSPEKSVLILEHQKINEKTKKQINFNQQTNCEYNADLQGYFNSPHQLITYRQKCIQNEQELQQSDKQINEYKNHDEQTYEHFPISKCTAQFKSLHKNLQNIQIKEDQNIGASKILSKSRQKRKLIAIKSHINSIQDVQMTNSLADAAENQQSSVPQKTQNCLDKQKLKVKDENKKIVNSINSVSEKIIKSLGKQTILNGLKIKQQEKRQRILKYKEQQQLKKLQQCSFKPKINKLSQSIQKNKKKMKIAALISMSQSQPQIKGVIKNQQSAKAQNSEFKKSLETYKLTKRYDDLYKNHKTIQAKKQYIRRKSIEQIPFRPDINMISTKIMETKRNSLNNSMCQFQSNHQSRQQSNVKSKDKQNMLGNSHYHCIEDQISRGIHKKRKSMQIQRNIEGLQIGDYLYKEAMRIKNKRESAPQSLAQNFKPLEKSEKIINKTKQKRLSQLFNQLVKSNNQKIDQNDNQKILCSTDINLSDQKFSQAPFKYILPLLQELQQLEVGLNQQEFIQSGLKLLSYLSPEERSQILLKKNTIKNFEESNKENLMKINKVSKRLVQNKVIFEQDIYHRGLLYKKEIKEKLQTNMQNKVRSQLKNCTFKPKINSNFQINE